MDTEKAGSDKTHSTEQELFQITEEMRSKMNEVYNIASIIPEKYMALRKYSL